MMPKDHGSSGRLTQWIRVCKCDAVPAGVNKTETVLCRDCGKRIATSKDGSITQWIFGTDTCKCEPTFKLLAGRRFAAPQKYEFEQEAPVEIVLDAESFPLERYAPLSLLASGGSGSVYRCKDRSLDRIVAVKALHVVTAERLLEFQKEAKTCSKLNHSSIVKVLDFGATASGAPFLVMEYIKGVTLARSLA
ncbi:MAG: protein kinase, partial [Cyanobacteria bacterium]|nr:protein kinase [Cyanobacteriota bacterium]